MTLRNLWLVLALAWAVGTSSAARTLQQQAGLVSTLPSGTVMARTAAEFMSAMANATVPAIQLQQDITFPTLLYTQMTSDIVVARNVTVFGGLGPNKYPALLLGWWPANATFGIRLAPNATLVFVRVLVKQSGRLVPEFITDSDPSSRLVFYECIKHSYSGAPPGVGISLLTHGLRPDGAPPGDNEAQVLPQGYCRSGPDPAMCWDTAYTVVNLARRIKVSNVSFNPEPSGILLAYGYTIVYEQPIEGPCMQQYYAGNITCMLELYAQLQAQEADSVTGWLRPTATPAQLAAVPSLPLQDTPYVPDWVHDTPVASTVGAVDVNDGGLPTGATAGIAVGAVVGSVLLVGAAVWGVKRARRAQPSSPPSSSGDDLHHASHHSKAGTDAGADCGIQSHAAGGGGLGLAGPSSNTSGGRASTDRSGEEAQIHVSIRSPGVNGHSNGAHATGHEARRSGASARELVAGSCAVAAAQGDIWTEPGGSQPGSARGGAGVGPTTGAHVNTAQVDVAPAGSVTQAPRGTFVTPGDGTGSAGANPNRAALSLPASLAGLPASDPSVFRLKEIITGASPVVPSINLQVDLERDVSLGAKLGTGAMGSVHRATYQGQQVAVKVFRQGADLTSFAHEISILGRTRHSHVVRLLGACFSPQHVALLEELCDGSLEELMYGVAGHEDREVPPPPVSSATTTPPGSGGSEHSPLGPHAPLLLPLNTVLSIAIEVASGLAYLHPTIIHRDLKPANILLVCGGGSSTSCASSPHNPVTGSQPRDDNSGGDDGAHAAPRIPATRAALAIGQPLPSLHVKLSDFGLSRMREAMTIVTQRPYSGTVPYMAPECFSRQHGLTHKCDIYSFGMCLWELLHGMRPWYGYSPAEVLYEVAVQNTRPPILVPDDRCPRQLRTLLVRCWDRDPHRRPPALEIVRELAFIQKQAGVTPRAS